MLAPTPVPAKPPPRHGPTPAPQHVRSTLLCSSLSELRARGFIDAYLANLPEVHHPAVRDVIAGEWLPLSLAMAHYQAIEALSLPAEVAFEMGAASGKRIHATSIHTLIRVAASAGVTPWAILGHYDRLWSRVFDGGAVTVTKAGPRDAVIRYSTFPPARFAYFRNAFRGANHAGLALFVGKGYVRELPGRRGTDDFAFRLSWA